LLLSVSDHSPEVFHRRRNPGCFHTLNLATRSNYSV
jgi:hypothetical protein